MITNFLVKNRNYGHWDIISDNDRLFRIRGGPGKYQVIDERGELSGLQTFKTVSACMSYVCDELMFQLILIEGQEPNIIEKWNL